MNLPFLHFKQFLQKKSHRSVNFKLTTLIWSSSRSFIRPQIRVRLVSLAHPSYMACIGPSYCYARQKFGSSISAGGLIALINFSKQPCWLKKKLTSVMFPTRSWCHVFYSWSQASFIRSQSSSTSLFCQTNVRKLRGLFDVCVGVIFLLQVFKFYYFTLFTDVIQLNIT